jgi:Ser/Thr protein kinase RdoA (MazF antagonist)
VSERPTEIPLMGGTANRGRVVRSGQTVRRPQRSTSSAAHALLRHLEDVGFDGAPRFLGTDAHGREVLSYIPGEAVTPPYPAWALTDSALRSVAQLLWRYHDAAAGFDAHPHRWPKTPPAPYGGQLVCHNDPNLDNVVFRDGRAVALIDFDLSSPGSFVWDVAGAVRLWSPLRDDRYIADSRRGGALSRLRTFVEAYGADIEPDLLVHAIRLNHDWMYAVIEEGVEEGNEGFVDYWRDAEVRISATREWYAENHDRLVRALSHPGS